MKDKSSVRTEGFDERSDEKGIGEGFGVKYFSVPGFFQKNAQRARWIDLVVADEILFRVFQIKVLSEALSHRKVHGLIVEKKTLVDGREVDRDGKTKKEDKDQKYGCEDRIFFLEHTIQQYHRTGKNSMNPALLYVCLFPLCHKTKSPLLGMVLLPCLLAARILRQSRAQYNSTV